MRECSRHFNNCLFQLISHSIKLAYFKTNVLNESYGSRIHSLFSSQNDHLKSGTSQLWLSSLLSLGSSFHALSPIWSAVGFRFVKVIRSRTRRVFRIQGWRFWTRHHPAYLRYVHVHIQNWILGLLNDVATFNENGRIYFRWLGNVV